MIRVVIAGNSKYKCYSPGVDGTELVALNTPRLGTLLARFVADFCGQTNTSACAIFWLKREFQLMVMTEI
jgi:hypothetical protein